MILFRQLPHQEVQVLKGMPKEGGEKEPFFRPLHSQLIAKPSMLNKAQPYGARKKEGKRLLPSGHLLRPNSPTLAYRTIITYLFHFWSGRVCFLIIIRNATGDEIGL